MSISRLAAHHGSVSRLLLLWSWWHRIISFCIVCRFIVCFGSQRIGILRLVKRIIVDTSVLLRYFLAFILPILEYCYPVWGSAAECHLQLLERKLYLVARLCTDQSFLLCHRRNAAGLSMLYKVNSNSNHSLFSELRSASARVRHTRAVAAAHPLEFDVSRCRTSPIYSRSRLEYGITVLYCVWYRNAGWVQWCSHPLVSSLSCVYFSFPVAQVLAGLRKQPALILILQLCCSHLGLCCWF